MCIKEETFCSAHIDKAVYTTKNTKKCLSKKKEVIFQFCMIFDGLEGGRARKSVHSFHTVQVVVVTNSTQPRSWLQRRMNLFLLHKINLLTRKTGGAFITLKIMSKTAPDRGRTSGFLGSGLRSFEGRWLFSSRHFSRHWGS